jgi:hypothetical protein
MQQFITQRGLEALEVLPALLQRPGAPAQPQPQPQPQAQAQAQAPGWEQAAVHDFSLNPEQAQVLAYVARWLQANPPRPASGAGAAGQGARPRLHGPRPVPSAAAGTAPADAAQGGGQQGPPPVCLVHGPFGSGK